MEQISQKNTIILKVEQIPQNNIYDLLEFVPFGRVLQFILKLGDLEQISQNINILLLSDFIIIKLFLKV